MKAQFLLKDNAKLDFNKAVEIVKEYERVAQDTKVMNKRARHGDTSQEEEMNINRSRERNAPNRQDFRRKSCFRCGDPNH